VLTESDGSPRIGRIATAASARGGGLGAALITHALAMIGDHDVVLHAQSHLTEWYEQFGFRVSGAGYVEDGIPHTPMHRAASQS
jgi:ElaA protein